MAINFIDTLATSMFHQLSEVFESYAILGWPPVYCRHRFLVRLSWPMPTLLCCSKATSSDYFLCTTTPLTSVELEVQ